jgi:hypothetical protein
MLWQQASKGRNFAWYSSTVPVQRSFIKAPRALLRIGELKRR